MKEIGGQTQKENSNCFDEKRNNKCFSLPQKISNRTGWNFADSECQNQNCLQKTNASVVRKTKIIKNPDSQPKPGKFAES